MFKHVLVVFLVSAAAENCPDRWALNDVDVWIHTDVLSPGRHQKSVNLYALDYVEMIDVTRANVSVLCDGMIKTFPKLKYLSLIEANISKIQPGAFQPLLKLTRLSLAVNHLTSVEQVHFQNLKNLEILFLSRNQIDNVEENAFADLIHLKKIYLDRNKLFEIDSNWFLNHQKISVIDLSFNTISKLQKEAFTLHKRSNVEIRLQSNQIEEVEPGAVATLGHDEDEPYLILHLEHNNLTEISSEFVRSMGVLHSTLIFDQNPIICFDPKTLQLLKVVSVELHAENITLGCDCLKAATDFTRDHTLRSTFKFFSSEVCTTPAPLWKFPDNY